MKGVQIIKVKVEFLEDKNEAEILDFIENIDYDFKHDLIAYSEIKEYSRNKDFDNIIYLNISLYFELDLDDEQIQEVVSEMDYNFHIDAIQETKIVDLID